MTNKHLTSNLLSTYDLDQLIAIMPHPICRTTRARQFEVGMQTNHGRYYLTHDKCRAVWSLGDIKHHIIIVVVHGVKQR